MPRESDFRPAVGSLWFRLISLAIVGLGFALALWLPHRIQGWTFYLTTSEVVFEIVVRLIFAALAGIALGTICTALVAPFLWYFDSSRGRLVELATRVGVVLVVFADSRLALLSLITWSNRGVRFTSALLVAHFLFFVVILCIPRLRREVVASLDGFLGAKMTRGIALATVIVTVALTVTEFALSKSTHTVKAAVASQHPKSNVLLITFDAFSAEEMSLYGYKLPITPNIDAFGRNATVFTNFYAGSTSTTPCIGVMLTGGYPSESKAYGLAGQLPAENAEKSLPAVMRAGGYATGAFLTNPWAYYLAKSVKNGFEVLPEPTFHSGGFQHVWETTRPLLWVHVVAPHHPYLPDSADQGRFIPEAELQTFREEPWSLWKPHYEPDAQGQVDRRRLAYDEYILSTDRAFGDFMKELEKSGRLRNTTVIVSADHGESFEGGVYQHQTPDLTRPVIHIPLIIKTPGQKDGRRVSLTADQTSLAPTILELAGQPKPEWMQGQSLVEWLKAGSGDKGEGLAFTQYLERNSVFKPLHRGSVGVIDGQYQYVFYLDTKKGLLRPLNQAQIWDLDKTPEDPARAESLRAAIHAKFPDVVPAK